MYLRRGDKMNDSVQKCFLMISIVGEAKSNYIQSIKAAKDNQFDKAEKLLKNGDDIFLQIHEVQKELSSKSVGKMLNDFQLLLMHAQDQVMSTEQFKIMAQEMNDCYRRIYDLEKKLI